jgi:hypothetical protein
LVTLNGFDLILLVGLALRLTHLVTTDDISERYLRQPLMNRVKSQRQEFWVEGLYCPWCIGFWISGLCLLSLWLAGGPGDAALWWRLAAGWFTLSYVVARVEAS